MASSAEFLWTKEIPTERFLSVLVIVVVPTTSASASVVVVVIVVVIVVIVVATLSLSFDILEVFEAVKLTSVS